MAGQDIFDIAVVGAGPAGLITGLACATSGLRTAVIGPLSGSGDGRTSALFGGSIDLLKSVGVWPELAYKSAPISAIRIVDATGGWLAAPEVLFRASEIGLTAFGYNVPNGALTSVLEAASLNCLSRVACAGVTRFDAYVDAHGDHIVLSDSEDLHVAARLVVAADGRNSKARQFAGIDVSSWSYPQTAIVTTFQHSRPHHGVSTELHRRAGPLTVVPGKEGVSHLVWVDTPEEAARLVALDDKSFAEALNAELKSHLGSLSDFSPRQSFPLTGQTARSVAKNRVVLVGEAAHVIPPIGAQGLNLSFRDAATVAEIAAEAKRAGSDIGGDATLARYDAARRTDISTRVFAVDLLNRSLFSNLPGVGLARGLGLFALAASPALRTRIMREGFTPSAATPALMAQGSQTVVTG
ncbi:FAD-dependent monooxygenase [Hyphomicrobium sp.]|uniref:FAD-dependent monooxygenase n=1 Tax=Hyphomicrobium sp. TaxID=82 RepID=UPI002D773E0F|nr:FAD-dependent monooxygenase [Hyphomicrobium sp.]HET6388167.1 FAD-dependent monooxygenase [Hyphomicrobium sp.]